MPTKGADTRNVENGGRNDSAARGGFKRPSRPYLGKETTLDDILDDFQCREDDGCVYEDSSNFPRKHNHRVDMGRPSETESSEKEEQGSVVTDFGGETSSDRVNGIRGKRHRGIMPRIIAEGRKVL
jgi:hypothetical protein